MKNPRQNRINPKGELVAHPAYGTFMGNRGILHRADGQIGKRKWRHQNWIICRTSFKGRKRAIMAPNRYTELFFLDEVTALAAGHRPCAECRRGAYAEFRAALERGAGMPASDRAALLDARLHVERVWPGECRQRTWQGDLEQLPDGTLIEHSGRCLLVAGPWLLQWSFDGYRMADRRQTFAGSPVIVLTPNTSVLALSGGYEPAVHESALRVLAELPGGRGVFSKVAGQTY